MTSIKQMNYSYQKLNNILFKNQTIVNANFSYAVYPQF